jgi:hypothetical protein
MKKFEISFSFRRHLYQADVALIHGKGHIQYSISPRDRGLFEEFGTQVIHEFTGKPMEFAFPGSTEEKMKFSHALVSGLRHFLKDKENKL